MDNYFEDLVFYRRKFRQIPEEGFLEMQTTIELIKILKSFHFTLSYGKKIHGHRAGLPSKTTMERHAKNLDLSDINFEINEIKQGYTGVIADLDTDMPGPKICFRFDIDALPISETKQMEHLPNRLGFESKNENTCHACGHDGHIAMGLVLCKYLFEHKKELCGSYRIIFQPAEEGVHGGKSLIEKGCVDNVDYMIGCHIGMNEKSGVIGVGTQGFLSTKKFDVTYWGRSAHAANNPEYGKNALLGAASLCLNLNSLIQYSTSNTKLNIGRFTAGNTRNIIPEDSHLQCEVRADHYTTLKDLWEKVTRAVQGSALTYNLQYRIDVVGEAIDFETKHPDFTEYINAGLKKEGFQTNLHPDMAGSEDVTYMLTKVEETGGKSIHFLIGTKLAAPHHNSAFDFDEQSLALGLNAFISTIKLIHRNH